MEATWALPCRLTVAAGCGQVANTLPKGGMSFHDWRLVHGSGKLTTCFPTQPSNVRARASCGQQPSAWRRLGPYSPARVFVSAEESRFEAFTSNQKHVDVFGPQNRTSPPLRAAALRFTCARRTLWRWAGLIMSSRGRTIATGLTLMGLRRLGAGEQSCKRICLL